MQSMKHKMMSGNVMTLMTALVFGAVGLEAMAQDTVAPLPRARVHAQPVEATPAARARGHAGGFEVPVMGIPGAKGSAVLSDGEKEVRVEQEDGRVKVFLDGELIYDDEMGDSEKVEVKGPNDEVVVTLLKSVGGPQSLVVIGGPNAEREIRWFGRTLEGFGGSGWAVASAEQPKVMLGVSMDEPGEALRQQLGLNEGETTILTNVMEDLPASKAGLLEYDIVTAIDGQTPAGPDHVRTALREKNPDDVVRFTILRAGKAQDFDVKLEAYDAAKLGWGGAGNWIYQFDDEAVRALREDLARLGEQRREALDQLRSLSGVQRDEMRAKADELREQMDELRRKIEEEMSMFGGTLGLSQTTPLPMRLRGPEALVLPPVAPGAPDQAEIERLVAEALRQAAAARSVGEEANQMSDAQIEALNERMERLERLMEQLLQGQKDDQDQ